jgi:hypothetical protein
LKQRNERETDRAREGSLDDEPRPACLLDEVNSFAVGQLGFRARHSAADPLHQVGGPAHVHEEGVRNSEIPACGLDLRKAIGSAHTVIHVPPESEKPFGHRFALTPIS